MTITGKSERHSRDVLKKIKTKLNKESHHLVSVREFCDYFGLDSATIESIIR
jgi:hypothetical protein